MTTFVRSYRIVGAALIISAAIYTLDLRWDEPSFSLGNFFSYFTNLSNFFAAGVLLAGALWVGTDRDTSPGWQQVRGAAVLYMVVTGLVYALLLSGYDSGIDSTPAYPNWVMHRIMPLVMLADWVYQPPRVRLDLRRNLVWLGFPIVYLAYTLIRGPIVDWYPYPFLDSTRDGGYLRVTGWCVVVAAAFVGVTWLITWLGNRLGMGERRAIGTTTVPVG